MIHLILADNQPADGEPSTAAEQDEMISVKNGKKPQNESNGVGSPSTDAPVTPAESTPSPESPVENGTPTEEQDQTGKSKSCCTCPESVSSTYNAWKTYISYTVSWAGMGIACFYMTVMGFDSITNGYGYSIGVPEYMIGIMRAFGSIAGIMGTLLFPVLHKRVGLERTGLYSSSFVILCLCVCVGSIWAPGSPFDPHYYQRTGYGVVPSDSPSPLNYVAGDEAITVQNRADDLLEVINSTLITEVVTEATTPPFTSSLITTTVELVTPTVPFVTVTPTSGPPRSNIGGKECVDYLNVEHSYWTAVLFFGGQIMQRMGEYTSIGNIYVTLIGYR